MRNGYSRLPAITGFNQNLIQFFSLVKIACFNNTYQTFTNYVSQDILRNKSMHQPPHHRKTISDFKNFASKEKRRESGEVITIVIER